MKKLDNRFEYGLIVFSRELNEMIDAINANITSEITQDEIDILCPPLNSDI